MANVKCLVSNDFFFVVDDLMDETSSTRVINMYFMSNIRLPCPFLHFLDSLSSIPFVNFILFLFYLFIYLFYLLIYLFTSRFPLVLLWAVPSRPWPGEQCNLIYF
jgi:hypothetical protein